MPHFSCNKDQIHSFVLHVTSMLTINVSNCYISKLVTYLTDSVKPNNIYKV